MWGWCSQTKFPSPLSKWDHCNFSRGWAFLLHQLKKALRKQTMPLPHQSFLPQRAQWCHSDLRPSPFCPSLEELSSVSPITPMRPSLFLHSEIIKTPPCANVQSAQMPSLRLEAFSFKHKSAFWYPHHAPPQPASGFSHMLILHSALLLCFLHQPRSRLLILVNYRHSLGTFPAAHAWAVHCHSSSSIWAVLHACFTLSFLPQTQSCLPRHWHPCAGFWTVFLSHGDSKCIQRKEMVEIEFWSLQSHRPHRRNLRVHN